ncbi:hypothetical protein [Micromonospora carbonacea]|uniref:Uncharacterized protein n=1 Tax=Micromonospora carbonacea TaxID=47853 RepID=A0A1C5AYZ0_9ACTN|nr:hypothetical protein [Micromonospora carbonacea]SCF50386.1 hypothetical protein GA0070563_13111 [Micromonospora carbonacea]
MTGVLLTIIACLLMLCATLVVLVVGRDRAARRAEAAQDEAVNEARAANRLRRAEVQELTTELAVARAELHARRRADDADTAPAGDTTWADRDLNTCRQIWAASDPTDTPGSTR